MKLTSRLQPPLQLELRNPDATAPAWLRATVVAIGVAIGILFLAYAADPGSNPYETMWSSTFGSPYGINQIITLATPLILAGCAVALARCVGLWNIGVDGQIYIGAWLATALAFSISDSPGVLLTVAMVGAGILGGALWAAAPILMYAYFRVNEVVTTLLLNFVAASWVLYWVTGPWANKGVQGAGSVTSKPLPEGASLPSMQLDAVTVSLGFAIAIAFVLALGGALRYTAVGFRASMIGVDEKAARYAGFGVRRIQIAVFLLSGAVGGLAGVVLELSQVHTLSTDLSSNTGYFGIVVAVLAGRSMAGTIPMGILMGALVAMGAGLQLAGVSSSAALALTGMLLVLAGAADAIARYRLRVRVPAVGERAGPDGPVASEGSP